MAEPEMSPATRLDDLAALGPLNRREVASALRHCSQWLGRGGFVDASRAIHDPLSCCLDLPGGEMLDLRRYKM